MAHHLYEIKDDRGTVVFYAKSMDEYVRRLEEMGGVVVKMRGRSKYRRFPNGYSGRHIDYSAIVVY